MSNSLEKNVQIYFSIRIGKYEFLLWKIKYEAPKFVEEVKSDPVKAGEAG